MIVKGQVEGLRKGKLFLQKFQDSIMINVDSTLVEGTPEFEFKTPLETAEVLQWSQIGLNLKKGIKIN